MSLAATLGQTVTGGLIVFAALWALLHTHDSQEWADWEDTPDWQELLRIAHDRANEKPAARSHETTGSDEAINASLQR